MNHHLEQESSKVAEVMTNGSSPEAAAALSQALTPLHKSDYKEFLEAVQHKRDEQDHGNKLDIGHNGTHIWSHSDLEPDYVVVTPGQTLSAICNDDLTRFEQKYNPKGIDKCINLYAQVNNLEDPNIIKSGSTLVIPGDLYN